MIRKLVVWCLDERVEVSMGRFRRLSAVLRLTPAVSVAHASMPAPPLVRGVASNGWVYGWTVLRHTPDGVSRESRERGSSPVSRAVRIREAIRGLARDVGLQTCTDALR